MLNSRNAVCILAVLVAGILTATCTLLFVVKWPDLNLKVSIDSKRFSRKQNVSPDNGILFETFHVTPRRHICLTQAVILSSTSNFFTTIATLCNKHATSSKKIWLTITFFASANTLMALSETYGFFSGFNWGHVCRLYLVYFDPCCWILFCGNYDWQLTFSECTFIFLSSNWSTLFRWPRL